jgi:hypothetical protein
MLAAIASLYGLFQITNPGSAGGELSDITVNYDDGFFYVHFNAAIKGYPAGEKLEVRGTMYDADTRRKLSDPKFQDQHATYIISRGYVNYRSYAGAIRVPPPEEPGDYYVKLELFAPDKSGESKPLDVEKSETTQIRAFKFELG